MADVAYEDFVRTGPGTLGGRYLRSFWQPVYLARELPDGRAVPIRIMGGDYTLYRGETGAVHLVAPRCAHRGTQLSTGWVEGDSIRCRYHGWKYEGSGQCVEQPGEEGAFAAKVTIRSYPVEEYIGLVFAYLGEGEPPPLRRYPDFEGEGALEAFSTGIWPCNYFNVLDNACDLGHVAYTHIESRSRMGRPDLLRLPKISTEETDYGIKTVAVVPEGRTNVLHLHMPNVNQVRSPLQITDLSKDPFSGWVNRLFIRVPVDDDRCINFIVDYAELEGQTARDYEAHRWRVREKEPELPNHLGAAVLEGKIRFEEISDKTDILHLTLLEDYLVQVGQGKAPDRSRDTLGRLDAGVLLMRKIWERELKALADGRPLKNWVSPGKLHAHS
jgi:5,5'-dehydrodivanillate O-demethylase